MYLSEGSLKISIITEGQPFLNMWNTKYMKIYNCMYKKKKEHFPFLSDNEWTLIVRILGRELARSKALLSILIPIISISLIEGHTPPSLIENCHRNIIHGSINLDMSSTPHFTRCVWKSLGNMREPMLSC